MVLLFADSVAHDQSPGTNDPCSDVSQKISSSVMPGRYAYVTHLTSSHHVDISYHHRRRVNIVQQRERSQSHNFYFSILL